MDITRTPLIYASKKISDADFVQASAMDLPFKEGTFDLVLCIEVLYQLTDEMLKKVLIQISYVTKKGGLKEMTNLLEKYDFEIVKKRSIFLPIALFAPFVIVFARKEE